MLELDKIKKKGGRPSKKPKKEKPAEVTQLTPEQIKAIEKRFYKESYYEFFKEAFKVLHNGEELVDNWHIEKLCNILQEEIFRIKDKRKRKKHLIINVPPRSLKSLIFSVVFPVWALLIKSNIKIITASHKAELANSLNGKSRRLMKSDWFLNLYGEEVKLSKDVDNGYETTAGAERKSFGIDGGIMGFDAEIIIADDLQNAKGAASDTVRKATNDAFKEDLSSRLINKATGLIINIQQRLHHQDVTGFILENFGDDFDLIKLPSEANSEDDVSPKEYYQYYTDNLFFNAEGYFSKEDLIFQKKLLGTKAYANQHLQKPSDEDSGIFKRNWFNIIDYGDFAAILNGRTPIWNFYIDTAAKDEKVNDASAFLVGCYIDKKLFVKDVQQVRKQLPDLIKYFKLFIPSAGYTPSSRIYIEDKSSGTQLIQMLRAEGGFNILPLEPKRDSKVVRAVSITPFVEAQNVYLIKGNYIEDFLEQVCQFSDSKSGHDDMVDAFVYACKYSTKGSLWYSKNN